MRWTICCAIWVTIAAVISAAKEDTRPKRDIALIKNFITTKLFGGGEVPVTPNYRLFRIPGFDNILVKAVPKVTLQEHGTPAVVVGHTQQDVHPAIALVSSYLGSNSHNETYTALEGVKNLIQSGVLSPNEESDDPYHVPIEIPLMTDAVQVTPAKEVLEVPVQYRVPIPYTQAVEKVYKPVRIPIPDLAFPTKYSYKQLHSDSVTSYDSNDAKNVVVTESKIPVQLPPYLSGRFQEVLAIGINRVPVAPVHLVKSPYTIPVNPYGPMEVTPAFIGDNYSYKHVHQDGSMSTYPGSGESIATPIMQYPRVNIYETPKALAAPYLPADVAPIVVPTNFSYKNLHNGEAVTSSSSAAVVEKINERPDTVRTGVRPIPLLGFFSGRIANVAATAHKLSSPLIPMNVTPGVMPTNYSYKQVHNDGTVTAYSGAEMVEKTGRPAIAIGENRSPILPPGYFTNNFESIAAAAYDLPPSVFTGEPVYSAPVSVLQGPTSYVSPEIVPTDYSFKHVHNDGTITAYSGADVVEHYHTGPTVVMEEARRPILPPGYFTNGNTNFAPAAHRLQSPAFIGEPAFAPVIPVYQQPIPFLPTPIAPEVRSSGYSYQHVHNDGTVTAYSGAGVVQERPSILVQEVRRPVPLPPFFANRIETIAATAHKFPQAVIEQQVYGPALPVYQDSYPALMEHLAGTFPKPLNPHFNDEVKINFTGHNPYTPAGYSYQTVHQDASSSVQFGIGSVQDNNNFNVNKPKEIQENRKNETPTKVDAQTQTGEFSYTTVHNDGSVTNNQGSGKSQEDSISNRQSSVRKPFTPSRTMKNSQRPINNGAPNSPVLAAKPIVSEYTYKQINTHTPNVPFTVVHTGDGPEKIEQIKKQIAETNEKIKADNSVREMKDYKDYIYMPPSTDSEPVIRTPSDRSKDNLNARKGFYSTEAPASSSAVSLITNPIVVLPEDRIFSYKQEKAGSSITVVADKTNKVSVVEENKRDNLESHRGDIPDISF